MTEEELEEIRETNVATSGGWWNRHIRDLLAEVARLKAGRFTEEEFQNLCHCLSEEDACRFKQGCEEYQRRLFGKGAVEEERQRCLLIVAAEPIWCDHKEKIDPQSIKDEITRKIREGN